MPMAMSCCRHAPAPRVRHARRAGPRRGLGRGRDAGVTPAQRMRSTVLFVASLVIAVAAPVAGAPGPPLLAVGVEAAMSSSSTRPRRRCRAASRSAPGARPQAHAGPAASLRRGWPDPPKVRARHPPPDRAASPSSTSRPTRSGSRSPPPPAPFAVELSADGRTAYLSNSETNEIWSSTSAPERSRRIGIGTEPLEVVATRADGKVVYATARAANELSAIDAKTMTSLGRVDAGMRPRAARVRAARGHRLRRRRGRSDHHDHRYEAEHLEGDIVLRADPEDPAPKTPACRRSRPSVARRRAPLRHDRPRAVRADRRSCRRRPSSG